jgi:hypothetical protein
LEEKFSGFYLRRKMNLKEIIMDRKVPKFKTTNSLSDPWANAKKEVPKFKMTNSVFDLWNIAKNTVSGDPAVRGVAKVQFKKFIIYCVIVGAILILLGIL